MTQCEGQAPKRQPTYAGVDQISVPPPAPPIDAAQLNAEWRDITARLAKFDAERPRHEVETASQVTLTRATNDLQIRISGATDVLTVKNWYVGTANRIEEIRLADGTVINTGTAAPLSISTSLAPLAARAALGRGDPACALAARRDVRPAHAWDRDARLLVEALAGFGSAGEAGHLVGHYQRRIPPPVDLYSGQ